jgi:hypothetical protein
MTDVWRAEEPIGRGLDKRLLHAKRRGQPCPSPVVVVTVRRGDELARPDEPAGLAVAQPLGRLGQREAERPKLLVRIGRGLTVDRQIARILLFLASWVSSALPSASSNGGMYMPNRPR